MSRCSALNSISRTGVMPGKGKKRREKNYKAAHGGDSRLPPPPDPSSVDAIPSKLRHLMQLMKGSPAGISGSRKDFRGAQEKKINRDKAEEKSISEKKEGSSEEGNLISADKKKRKRGKKGAKDLRFLDLEVAGGQRRQKRKEFHKARKTKNKRAKNSETSDFPEREEVQFGEIVEAPPKLSFPKGAKSLIDASSERRRLHAIDAYRTLKGWESRPGIHLPPISEPLP